MRKLLVKLHLWASLAVAVPLLVVGITGAILVYGEELDMVIDPQHYYVTSEPVRLPMQAIINQVGIAYPDEEVRGVSLPAKPGLAVVVSTKNQLYVYVNPHSGKVLGAQHLESGFRRKVFLLHTRLMAGNVGHNLVIISTIVAIFLTISGLVLWWRLKIWSFKWWKSSRRKNFDLHNVFGVWSAIVLLILSVTGVLIAYDSVTYPAIMRLGGESPPGPPPESVRLSTEPATIDDVIAASERAVDGARITYVSRPQDETGVYTAYARFPEDPATFGRSRVLVDQYNGEVLHVRSTRDAGWGTYLTQIMEPVHFGDIFGAPSQIIAFLASLLLGGQIITGVLIWFRKKLARRRGRRIGPERQGLAQKQVVAPER